MNRALDEALGSAKPVYLADVLRPKSPPIDALAVLNPEDPKEVLDKGMPQLERAPSFYVLTPRR